MEFQFSAADAVFESELRQFISDEYVPEWELGERGASEDNWQRTLDIRRKLADRGWLTMHWPEEYGGQKASPVRTAIFNEAMTYHRAPGRDNFGVRMMGATLMIQRHRGAESRTPATGRQGRRAVVPGLQRTGIGLRFGIVEHPRHPRRRRIRHQRQQNLDLPWDTGATGLCC